jgi:hypothetical protein
MLERRRSDWSTPQTTIDAVMHCVRERGLAALREPANQQRLIRFDDTARAEVNRRIAKIVAPHKGKDWRLSGRKAPIVDYEKTSGIALSRMIFSAFVTDFHAAGRTHFSDRVLVALRRLTPASPCLG